MGNTGFTIIPYPTEGPNGQHHIGLQPLLEQMVLAVTKPGTIGAQTTPLFGHENLLPSLIDRICTKRAKGHFPVITGGTGFGKSALALSALNSPKAVFTFQNRRCWIDLAEVETARDLMELVTTRANGICGSAARVNDFETAFRSV